MDTTEAAPPPPPSPPLPPPPSPPHPPPDSPPAPQNPPPPAANNGPHPILHVPPPHPPHPEWFSLFMNFFFTGVSISIQSNSNKASSTSSSHHQLPISFQIAALGMVFSLAAFVVSKYMPAGHDLGAQAQVQLENVGVFFGVTGFFIDITPCFPLCLKIISWTVYTISLIAIIITRNFNIFRQ